MNIETTQIYSTQNTRKKQYKQWNACEMTIDCGSEIDFESEHIA